MLALAVSGTVAAYIVIAMLLLSLNITSLWRWWVKAAAMIVTTVFFAGTYVSITSLLGWPTPDPIPERFNLLYSRVIEPDKATGAPGFIYLWVEELDQNNLPATRPRAYQLVWDDSLAHDVSDAQEKRDQGKEMMGEVKEEQSQKKDQKQQTEKIKLGQMQKTAEQATKTDTVPFKDDSVHVTFLELPPVLLPDKGPIFVDTIPAAR